MSVQEKLRTGAGLSALMFGSLAVFSIMGWNNNEPEPRPHPSTLPQFRPLAGLTLFEQTQYPDQVLVQEYFRASAKYQPYTYEQRAEMEQKNGILGLQTVIAVLSLIAYFILRLPLHDYLRRSEEDIRKGVAATVDVGKKASAKLNSNPVIGRNGLTTFSVADELLKWKQLLDAGAVSQAEYDAARAELLKRK